MNKLLLLILLPLFLCSACTVSKLHHVKGEHGVDLYVPRDITTAKDYFQNHKVMVGGIVHTSGKDLEEGRVMMDYPSVNDGPSPIYSHSITVSVPNEVNIPLKEVRNSRKLIIVEEKPDHSGWILRGTVSPEAGGSFAMNWFADKYLYWYSAHPLELMESSTHHECCMEKKK